MKEILLTKTCCHIFSNKKKRSFPSFCILRLISRSLLRSSKKKKKGRALDDFRPLLNSEKIVLGVLCFWCLSSVDSTAAVWSGLDFPAYQCNIMMIGCFLPWGILLERLFYPNTSYASKGRFARVCVSVYFNKPLVPLICIDDRWHKIEYEARSVLFVWNVGGLATKMHVLFLSRRG